ncbi:MAG: PAS domain S-box protein [Janthinobacterium lividum]
MTDREQLLGRQQVLADFGDLALRSEDLDHVLTEACRLVSEALGTTRAKVLEIRREEGSLLVRAGVGWDEDVVGRARVALDERSSETYALEAGEPVITQDIGEEDRFGVPAFMREAGVVALANVPIVLPGGRVYGLLEVDDVRPRRFGPDDTKFLRTYAVILGPVIDRLLQVRDLRASRERFRLTVAAARDYAILVTDAQDRIVDWLPGAQAVFGWTAEEALGQPAAILFTPEDRVAGQPEREAETARARGVAPDVRWHLHRDGSRVFIEGSVTALRDEDGAVGGFLKIGQDVTERRRTETRLRESEARQRALIEGLPQLVWRSAAGGRWTWVSPQWVAYTGLSAEASLGLGWLDALHPADREGAMRAWGRAGADGLFRADCRILHEGSGRYRWFQTRSTPVHGKEGEAVEWIGTSTDIDEQIRARDVLARSREELEARVAERTAELQQAMASLRREVLEREGAEERLRQSEKLKAIGQLTGGIAHDFNNMLQAITSGLSMIRLRVQQDRLADVVTNVERAEKGAKRAAALTHRLLAFGRQQTLAPKVLSLGRIAHGMEDMIRRSVGPSVQTELRLADGRWLVMCDPNQLESALLNLCVNARDAMPDGGWLVIATEELVLSEADVADYEDAAPGRYAAIAVSDTGTGMTPEVAAHVFEPFFTTKPLGQGTGLGLSQIYGFVRQSGGVVQFETKPGKGTTFRLCMPHHEDNPEAGPVASPSLGRTVLLVEDEQDVREMTAELLRELGCRVLEAEDGAAALRLVRAGTPHIDLLVTDVGLPGSLNGRQVAEAACERYPGLPVVLVTGYAAGLQFPGMEVVHKPFDPGTFAELVRGRLEALGPPRA